MAFSDKGREIAAAIRAEFPDMKLRIDAPMSEYTTLHLGGPADAAAEPGSEEEAAGLVRICRREQIPFIVTGRGSNLLVRDGGIRGLVIVIGREMSRVEIDGCLLSAQAGVSMARISQAAANAGLSGCEFMSGIPGNLGGGIVMNAGAYGGEMSRIVKEVSGITSDGEAFTFTADQLDFSYRHSVFSSPGRIVTGAVLSLEEGNPTEISAKIADLAARRRMKQPTDKWSCGSTFKRPETGYAAQMIDECGLKGARIGGAYVSEKHAGFLINEGTKAEDYLKLMDLVRERVREKFGITLENEVQIIGEN